MSRIPFAFMGASGGGGAPFDIVAETGANGYWDGPDYDGAGTWPGVVGGDLTAITFPTTGATQNGLDTVDFARASSHRLNGGAMTTWAKRDRGWIMTLVQVRSIVTDNASGAAYLNEHIVAESGGVGPGLALKATGSIVQPWGYDTAMRFAPFGITEDVYQLLTMKWEGSTLSARLGKGAWQTDTLGTIDPAFGSLRVGTNYNSGQFADMLMAALLIGGQTNAIPSDATFDDAADYLAARWAVTL